MAKEKELIYIVIDNVTMIAYTNKDKADKAYSDIVHKRWHGNFDDYGRAIGMALLEHYTSIDGRTIMRRALFLERD